MALRSWREGPAAAAAATMRPDRYVYVYVYTLQSRPPSLASSHGHPLPCLFLPSLLPPPRSFLPSLPPSFPPPLVSSLPNRKPPSDLQPRHPSCCRLIFVVIILVSSSFPTKGRGSEGDR